jgi:hypothetical protein
MDDGAKAAEHDPGDLAWRLKLGLGMDYSHTGTKKSENVNFHRLVRD